MSFLDTSKNIDHEAIRAKIASIETYWENQSTDDPHTVNGFKGTWNFSDHALIPDSLHNFIMESFHPQEKMKRIPLADINALMNDVWEGPGSMPKIMNLLKEMRSARSAGLNPKSVRMDDVKTIDDYDDSDFSIDRSDDRADDSDE